MSSGGLAVSDEVPKELSELMQGVIVLAVACAGPFAQKLGIAARIRGNQKRNAANAPIREDRAR